MTSKWLEVGQGLSQLLGPAHAGAFPSIFDPVLAGALDWQSANRWPGRVTAFGCGCDRGSLANPFRVLRTGQAAPGNALTDALDDLADLAEQAGLVEDPKVSASRLPSAWNT